MNKERRLKLQEGIKLIIKGKSLIEDVLDEERSCFENLSEGLQQTMRGETMEENVDILEDNIETIDEVIEELNNVC